VPYGAIYSMTAADDPAPVLREQPVRISVLGVTKGRSYVDASGDLQRLREGEPDTAAVGGEGPEALKHLPDVRLPHRGRRRRTPQAPAVQALGRDAAKAIKLELLHARYGGEDPAAVRFERFAESVPGDRAEYVRAVVRRGAS